MIHNKGALRSSYASIPLGIFTAVVTMSACGSSQPPPQAPASSTAQAAPDRFGATLMQPSDPQPSTPEVARPVVVPRAFTEETPVSDAQLATLDDAHIAGLVEEVNDGAARLANVGDRRVTDHEVKRFAHEIAAKHLAAQTMLRTRLSELGIEPASGPVSEQVRVDVQGDLDTLPSATGQDFDRVYVDGQLRNLTRAAELLDRITARVKGSDRMASVIDALRTRLDADIRGAQSLRDSLRNGTTNERPDAFDPDKSHR
jgi:predicted outer membrane protein